MFYSYNRVNIKSWHDKDIFNYTKCSGLECKPLYVLYKPLEKKKKNSKQWTDLQSWCHLFGSISTRFLNTYRKALTEFPCLKYVVKVER